MGKRLLAEGEVNFCYVDESGTGSEPIATMVGIVVDSARMNRTKTDWTELLADLRTRTGRPIAELHTADFYSGNGVWRGIDGPGRADVISTIFEWLRDRKHHVVYSSVVKASYHASRDAGEIPKELGTLWRFLGFHLILAVQRYSQLESKNKGHTYLVFDNEEGEKLKFPELVVDPPGWSDEYYARRKKQSQLDQIVDVPSFSDSKHVHLLQVAHFLAFFLRRYAEIQEGAVGPKYDGEDERITDWLENVRSIGRAHIYPQVKINDAHRLFIRHAPASIVALV